MKQLKKMFLSKLGLPRSETHNWPNYDWESGWGVSSPFNYPLIWFVLILTKCQS